MAERGKQLAILPLQLLSRYELHTQTVHRSENLAGVGEIFGRNAAKQAQPFVTAIGLHRVDLAHRTHHRAIPRLAALAVARDHQLAFAEYLPGAETEEIAGPLVEPLHSSK